ELCLDNVAVQCADCPTRTKNRPAQRMISPKFGGEELMQQVIGVVFLRLNLFQNYTALFIDVGRIEKRVQDQIAEYVKRDCEMLVQHHSVEAHALLGGKSVKMPANRIH